MKEMIKTRMIKNMNILFLVLFILKHSVAMDEDIINEKADILNILPGKHVRFPRAKDLPCPTPEDKLAIKMLHNWEDVFLRNVWDGKTNWLENYLSESPKHFVAPFFVRQKDQMDFNREFTRLVEVVTGVQSNEKKKKKVRMTLLHAAVYRLKLVEEYPDSKERIEAMLETIRLLLASKENGRYLVDVNEVGRRTKRSVAIYGDTALHLAVTLEFQDKDVRHRLVKLLLGRQDIDLTICDASEAGNTAFFYAYDRSRNYVFTRFHPEYSADIATMIFDHMIVHDTNALNAPINGEDTILHLFAKYGDEESARKVLSKVPMLINRQNEAGETALHIAAQTSPAMYEMMMTYNADPKICTNDGQTAEAIRARVNNQNSLQQTFEQIDSDDCDSMEEDFLTWSHERTMDQTKNRMEKTLEEATDRLADYEGALEKQLTEIEAAHQYIGASESEDPNHCRMELTCGVKYSEKAAQRCKLAFPIATAAFDEAWVIKEAVKRIEQEVQGHVRRKCSEACFRLPEWGGLTQDVHEDITNEFFKHIAKRIEDRCFSAKHNPNTIVAASLIFVDSAVSTAKKFAQYIDSIRRSLKEIELRFNAECAQHLCQDDIFLRQERREENARYFVSLAEELTAIIKS